MTFCRVSCTEQGLFWVIFPPACSSFLIFLTFPKVRIRTCRNIRNVLIMRIRRPWVGVCPTVKRVINADQQWNGWSAEHELSANSETGDGYGPGAG